MLNSILLLEVSLDALDTLFLNGVFVEYGALLRRGLVRL